MIHEEVDIDVKNYKIKADIKIPSNRYSTLGIVLVHGGIINRKSLLRTNYCLGEYLCENLGAYVIAPDFLGETIHRSKISFNSYSEIINISTEYFVENFNLNNIMGFGHSMGSYILANSLPNNPYLCSIVNYGGPIKELERNKKRNLIKYLLNYLTMYDYKIDIKNLVNYIFDEETSKYLQGVMLKNKEYGYENYNFTFDSSMFMDVSKIIYQYVDVLKKWRKPVLLLFGSEDKLTKTTYNYYSDSYMENNIKIKHVKGASHVTPCMESKFNLSKLNDILSFFRYNQTLATNEISKHQ